MALTQPLLVGSENQRDVRELRNRRTYCAIQQNLLRRIGNVIVTPHHMRDLHLHIVGHDRQLVGRVAVRAQDDEVFDGRAVDLDRAVHEIVESDDADRDFEAHGARPLVPLARGDVIRRQMPAQAIVFPAPGLLLPSLPAALDLFRRAVAVVRAAACDKLRCHRAMTIDPLRLKVRCVVAARAGAFIPVQAEPAQAVEDPADHLVRRSLGVGVFDAEDERAAVPPREEPVEERGTRPAYMEVPGWRRSKSNTGGDHGRANSVIEPSGYLVIDWFICSLQMTT